MFVADINMGIHSTHSDVQIKEINSQRTGISCNISLAVLRNYVKFIKCYLKPQMCFDENKWTVVVSTMSVHAPASSAAREGFISCMHPANVRRRYIVTSSPIRRAHTQNDPCKVICGQFDLCPIPMYETGKWQI